MITKVLISFAVTAKLICVFVFAYAKRLFSHYAAQLPVVRADILRTSPSVPAVCLVGGFLHHHDKDGMCIPSYSMETKNHKKCHIN